jgi:NitT/TauT family transport system permease protein
MKDKIIKRVLSLAIFFATWWLVHTLLKSFPGPVETIQTFLKLITIGDPLFGRTLQELVWESLKVVLKGAGLAFLAALPLGIFMGAYRPLEEVGNLIIEIIRPVPPLAWIPVAYLAFGGLANPTAYVQTFVVAVGVFFPSLLNTVLGIKLVEPIYSQSAKTMGASWRQILLFILLPGAIPSIITGLRIGLGIGWMSIIAAEFVGGKMGIGYYIWAVYNIGGRAPEILAGIVAIGLVGYLINEGVVFIEKRLIKWR